jgi:hypothetical protein
MIETFKIFYEHEDGGWELLVEVEDTLINILEQIYSYAQDKKYRVEKVTILGSQVINFE